MINILIVIILTGKLIIINPYLNDFLFSCRVRKPSKTSYRNVYTFQHLNLYCMTLHQIFSNMLLDSSAKYYLMILKPDVCSLRVQA